MKIGYARVSTKWYQSELQITELEKQGCDKVWCETLTDDQNSNHGLKDLLDQISAGDTVIATRLTSIAHSSAEFLYLLEKIQEKGAFFRSLAEPWVNTKERGGDQIIESIRGMINFEMTLASMENKREFNRPQIFGVSLGRPRKLTEQQKNEAMSLLRVGKSAAEIGRLLGVSRSTISRLKNLLR
ncbi:transposase [Alphaproteobacteria bacterium 46_93_T64]|nr:transposase [Alphaproteobacteria bacterium 46_93_T64]